MARNAPILDEAAEMHQNGDNCIQNFHLRRYIIVYTVRIYVLLPSLRVAVKQNFSPYIGGYTSPNENLNTVIP